LRLEDFKVNNAPGLAIYLSAAEDVKTLADKDTPLFTAWSPGELLGTVGAQQFIVIKEYADQLNQIKSVIIGSEALQEIYGIAVIN
jgi:hypothetical protein